MEKHNEEEEEERIEKIIKIIFLKKMFEEFKKGIHLSKFDLIAKTPKYKEYQINRAEGKEFQVSTALGLSSVYLFWKKSSMKQFSKNFYSLVLFSSIFSFSYIICNKFFTDNKKVIELTSYLLENK